jgi:uncharacterized protein YwqG
MAISIRAKKSERILFCASKWWGDPDMPENMEYPTIMVDDEGESYEYPLTFVCQINCEEIASFDPEGQLPHEGMLYFFAAMDEWLGYESPTTNGAGEWAKGHFVVKYAKAVNFETFRSCIMVDDEDNSLTEPELEMIFEGCDDSGSGLKLLGIPDTEEVRNTYPEMISLLQIDSDEELGVNLGENGRLNLMMKLSDLKFGNWKKTKAYLHVK